MIVTIEDLREHARRRLPRALFDYVDGGAEDEHSLRANRQAFAGYTFSPRVLTDVSMRDQSTTVLGEQLATPLILAPTGFSGALWPRGEVLGARAAAAKGIVYVQSTLSICSIEEAAQGSQGPHWFQLYVWRDREVTRSLVERARAAGCRVLVVTVDTPILGQRERDLRNGLVLPPRLGVANVLDALRRPSWLLGMLGNPRMTFGNFRDTPGVATTPGSLAEFIAKQFSPSVSWDDFDWLRSLWPGPVVVKGIMSGEEARRAADHGASGIVVSNHGGRQSDHLPGTIEVLPEVVEAVQGRVEVLLDGGIRRGTDVVKAVALGASACMIGRAYNYGLAAGGQAGAEKAIDILRSEVDRCLALIGRPSLAGLDASAIRGRTAERRSISDGR